MADNVVVRVPEQQFIRGEDGFDPVVTIESIEHGHRVTITDREHPVEGQTFNVLDGDSAYEQAVAGGYEGTEAEFNTDLAGFSEKAQTAASAAASAAQSAQDAAAAAAQSVNAFIEVSETQPTEPANKLWINDGNVDEYIVPTYNEFNELKSAVFNDKLIAVNVNNSPIIPSSVTSDGEWVTANSRAISNNNYQAIRVIANSAKNSYISFLKSIDVSVPPEFATGETRRHGVAKGTSQVFTIPTDCNYIVIGDEPSSGASLIPSCVILYSNNSVYNAATVPMLNIRSAETLPFTIKQIPGNVRPTDGSYGSGSSYFATDKVDISRYEFLAYSCASVPSTTLNAGIAFYDSDGLFIEGSGVPIIHGAATTSYVDLIVKKPDGAMFVCLTGVTNLSGFYLKGINRHPLFGLKLSLLGDSMSAYTGSIPDGNHPYYTGSNAGVKSVREIWWQRLCDDTGMIPWVIDAWSGSSICYNNGHYDNPETETYRAPMCSDLRTERLAKDGEDPDIIIIAGGTNDWSYATANTTQLGNWDGTTAVSSEDVLAGNSTFMESYAYLINKLHTLYPNAIIVCCSMWFMCRGTAIGFTKVNSNNALVCEYSTAVQKVCNIMGVPYLNVYNIGFTYNNYYPTYAKDSASTPTHTNSLGQAVIAKRFIEELPGIVKQFK